MKPNILIITGDLKHFGNHESYKIFNKILTDELNNQIGFAIYEEAQGDPDKINELIRQKAIEKYKVN